MLPGTVTYTLTPRSSSSDLLDERSRDRSAADGRDLRRRGPGRHLRPLRADRRGPGQRPGPPVLDTAMTVEQQLRHPGRLRQRHVERQEQCRRDAACRPTDLGVSGGTATCTGPMPASANVPAGGAGVNFVWSCTLDDLGEYVFSAGADDAAATTSWPDASSASVLSAASGGPNVVTWNLGSNTAGVPAARPHERLHRRGLRLPRREHQRLSRSTTSARRLVGKGDTPANDRQGRRAHHRRCGDDLRLRGQREADLLRLRHRDQHLDDQGQTPGRTSAKAARSSTWSSAARSTSSP